MGLRRILVNRKIVEQNELTGQSDPVFTVIDDQGGEHHGSSIILTGPCEVKYDRTGRIGTRIWIETFDRVVLKNVGDTESGCPSLVGI